MSAPRLFSLTSLALVVISSLISQAEAGDRLFRKRARPPVRETVATSRPQDVVPPSPMLGSFRPSSYIMVGANPLIAGGSGRENSLSVYGPLSAFRSYAAPVNVVVRGYDGVPTVVEGTGFSYPNLPALSPFVYPTAANNYTALPFQRTPPQLDRGSNWIDLN